MQLKPPSGNIQIVIKHCEFESWLHFVGALFEDCSWKRGRKKYVLIKLNIVDAFRDVKMLINKTLIFLRVQVFLFMLGSFLTFTEFSFDFLIFYSQTIFFIAISMSFFFLANPSTSFEWISKFFNDIARSTSSVNS